MYPQFPHIRSLMNRAGATLLLHWAVTFALTFLAMFGYMIFRVIQMATQSMEQGQTDSALMAETLMGDLMSDPLLISVLMLASPVGVFLAALSSLVVSLKTTEPLF